MTTTATASSLREATSPEALTLAPDADSSQHTPPPPERTPPRREASPTNNSVSSPRATGRRHASPHLTRTRSQRPPPSPGRSWLNRCAKPSNAASPRNAPHGTYDDTRAGHDAFSRGLVEDYDHGNHHLARATIRVADPGLVTCVGLSHLGLPDAIDTVAAAAIGAGARLTDVTTQYIDEEKALASIGIDPWATRSSDEPTGQADRILYVGRDGACSWAMRSGVDVVCLSRRGYYQGTLIGANRGAHASRLLAQVALFGDRERRVRLAASLIGAKIRG